MKTINTLLKETKKETNKATIVKIKINIWLIDNQIIIYLRKVKGKGKRKRKQRQKEKQKNERGNTFKEIVWI